MIVTEYYLTRNDGVKLYRTYSDRTFKIRQLPSQSIYDEAIDVENNSFTYEETNIPIDLGSEEQDFKYSAEQLLAINLITVQSNEDDTDYFHENELESNYFN